MNSNTASFLIKKAAGTTSTFVLSSSAQDRDGDIILPSALAKAAAKSRRLLCLWQHDRQQPIGVWEKLRVESEKLLGDLRVASTNLGQMVQKLLDEDIPLYASIGFMGGGQPNRNGGIDYDNIELLECSVVSVPSNPEARRIAKSFGLDIQSSDGKVTSAMSGLIASKDAIVNAKRAIARVNLMRSRQ